jgi:exopolysaccharide biosynthesis polyprenyl glycosylphosphotransferase
VAVMPPWSARALRLRPRVRRIVIVSSGEPERPLKLISARLSSRIEVARLVLLGESVRRDHLPELLSPESLRRDCVSGIVIANGDHQRFPTELLVKCGLNGIAVFTESNFWTQELGCIDVDGQDQQSFIPDEGGRCGRIEEIVKRVFDVLLATVMLILAFPLMVLIAGLIKLDSSGPIIYRQERVGLRGRTFTLYKFRSMHQNAEPDGSPRWAIVGDPRITRIGRLIRYARIDELPQLLNVLRGDMSIVGPRPERPYFVEKLEGAIPFFGLRHTVKPGITGWAQVNASYGASIEDARVKLSYDLYYIKQRRFILDLKILLLTLRVIILQEGAR